MALKDEFNRIKIRNDLIQTMRSAYQSSKKNRALSREVELIEESISAQLDKIEQAYMQLGQAYLLKHPKDYDKDYQSYVNQILDAKEIIDAFNEKLRKIKGLRICPKCGAEIVYDAKFCNYCGTKLEPLSSEQLFELLEKQALNNSSSSDLSAKEKEKKKDLKKDLQEPDETPPSSETRQSDLERVQAEDSASK